MGRQAAVREVSILIKQHRRGELSTQDCAARIDALYSGEKCGSRSPVTGCRCELQKGHDGVHKFQEAQWDTPADQGRKG